MLRRLLILMIVLPVAEIVVLVQVGRRIGGGWILLLLFLGIVAGSWVARRQGLRSLTAVRTELGTGHAPGDHILEALLVFVAGGLLAFPGFLSDVIGLLLLLPPVRTFVRTRLKRRFQSHFVVFHPGRAEGDDFIDVQARPADEDDRPPPPQLQ